jgi:glycine C-acetyltransferase
MFGDAVVAARMAELLLAKGVYVVAFSYPVVPMGKARIRTQISAAHSRHELEFAVRCFAEAKRELESARLPFALLTYRPTPSR